MVPTIDRSKATRMIKVGFLKMDARILPDMSAKVAFLEGIESCFNPPKVNNFKGGLTAS